MSFSSLRAHIGALGFVATLTIATVTTATMAMPAPAATDPAVIGQFVVAEPNDIKDGPLAGAMFNVVSFTNHPCYVITNDELQMCKDTYGITSSLKDLLDNGSVAAYLSARGLLAKSTSVSVSAKSSLSSPSSFSSSSSVSSVSMEQSSSSMSASSDPYALATPSFDYEAFQKRGAQLWEVCAKRGTPAEAAACYQRNIRLITRDGVAIDAQIVY